MRRLSIAAIVIFSLVSLGDAQKSKVVPTRLRPDSGVTLLSGVLGHSQEKQFIFSGSKGQTASFSNPNPSLFDVRLFDPVSGFDTEYDSSRTFEVELPESADYVIYIRRKVGGPRTARFRVSFRVR